MVAAESDYEGFQDAVEFWGVEMVPGWVQILERSKSSSERNAALRALGIALRDNGLESVRRAAATQAVPSLVSLLRTEKGIFRRRIVNALRAMGPGAKAASPALLAILRNPDDPDEGRFSIRSGAALALGDIQEPPQEIAHALGAALHDGDEQVRRCALSALKSLSWQAMAATNEIESVMLKHGPEFQKAAAQALLEIRRPRPLLVGDLLPEIELPKLGPGRQRLSALQGKIIVLDFWSAHCPPCQPAMTHLDALAKRRTDWAERVAFLGISEDETSSEARAHAAKRGWQSVQLLFDQEQKVHQLFRSGLPELILVDGQGKIVWRGHPTEVALEAEIERLLGRN
jgi:peroxiredoxin